MKPDDELPTLDNREIAPASHQPEFELKRQTAELLIQATGTTLERLSDHLINQVVCASFSKIEKEPEKLDQQVQVVLGALHAIGPKDELEGMLAVQMIGVHNLAMRMMRGAQENGMTTDQITHKVNRATKLSNLFLAQLEALNRYRGKGQQKVTVEHVTVNSGGQAIVGVVGREGGGHG